MTADAAVVAFLYLLREEPTLLDPAPGEFRAGDIDARRGEVHACLRCGQVADVAVVALTKLGARWLDLCHEHYDWIARGQPDQFP